jgi:hypothetical protein
MINLISNKLTVCLNSQHIINEVNKIQTLKCVAKLSIWLHVVVYTCNPSDSGDVDWEDHGSRPAWAKS